MKPNCIAEEIEDQTRPTQPVGASSGMKNRQRRIAISASDFCQARKKISIFTCNEIFAVTADCEKRFATHHLKFAASAVALMQKIVPPTDHAVHDRKHDFVDPSFAVGINAKISGEPDEFGIVFEMGDRDGKEMFRLRHDAIGIEKNEPFACCRARSFISSLSNRLSRSCGRNDNLIGQRTGQIDSAVVASAIRDDDFVRQLQVRTQTRERPGDQLRFVQRWDYD